MSISTRITPRLRHICCSATSPSRAFTSTARLSKEEWPQRSPLGPFYESILRSPPLRRPASAEPPNSADPEVLPPGKKPLPTKKNPPATKEKPAQKATSSTSFKTTTSFSAEPLPEMTPEERARLILGTRHLTEEQKAARVATRRAQSTYVAGVLVPPKPEEPDNCCMSGCVNCVWERYREEMEEWSLANNEAEKRLKAGAGTIDADGGPAEASWGPKVGETKIAKDMWDEDIFDGVPVGIREFMKQEKRLKERHEREDRAGN